MQQTFKISLKYGELVVNVIKLFFFFFIKAGKNKLRPPVSKVLASKTGAYPSGAACGVTPCRQLLG
jgi:hypothetical protein